MCDTKGLPIYVDGHLAGYSPLKNPVDVLPGWHKVGYFPNDYTQDVNAMTSKEKIMNDILVMEILWFHYQDLQKLAENHC